MDTSFYKEKDTGIEYEIKTLVDKVLEWMQMQTLSFVLENNIFVFFVSV